MTSAIRINKVAVLIDGDNISADHASAISRISCELGEVVIRRVYGNVHHILKWEAVPGYRVIHSGIGKNATDMLIAIDAMELALQDGFDTLLIASSDSDFTHLVLRLRERQFRVVGAGEDKAGPSLRQAFADFKLLGNPIAPPSLVAHPQPDSLDLQLRALIAKNSQKGRGMPIKALASAMHRDHGIKISEHAPNWRSYFARKPAMYAVDPKGEDACVRFVPAGFAAK